ncbi:MAG: hypothetical protein AB8B62_02520 [Roseobacter sp.]
MLGQHVLACAHYQAARAEWFGKDRESRDLQAVQKADDSAPNHLNKGYSAKRLNGVKLPADTNFGRKTAQIQGLLAKKSKPVRKRWLSVVLETSYSHRQALGGVTF